MLISVKILLAILMGCLSMFSATRSNLAVAGPSGGPYGPQIKEYSIPTGKNVYFVAPDGVSEASGAKMTSATTLAKAIAQANSGDVIVLRGGVYRTGSLVLNQGITIQPYKDEAPILKGTKIATNWKKVQDGVWQTSWDALFPSQPMFWWRRERNEDRTPLHRFNNDMVFVDGKFLQSAGHIDELNPSRFYIDYQNKQVYIGVNPAQHTIEITAHQTALTRTSAEVHGKVSDKKGPHIYGIKFTQYAWTALSIEGKRSFTHTDEPVDEPIGVADPATYGKQVIGTLLDNVTISFCGRVAGYFRGDGLIIRNSLISDTSTEGLYVIGSSNVLIERNIVLRNNIENITGYFASAVKIINQTHNVIVRDNLVKDHPNSVGVWYDIGNQQGIFIDNYIENTEIGFFFEISRGAEVAGNVFVDNDEGIRILNSADAHIYNNTFVDSRARIERTERSAEGDHFAWHPATGPGVEERNGHTFINNVLVASHADSGSLLKADQSTKVCQQLTDSPVADLNGNIYIRPSAAYPNLKSPLIEWIDTEADTCLAPYATLTAFQSSPLSLANHGLQLEGDPRAVFVAPDLKNFHLRKAAQITARHDFKMPKAIRKHLGWSKRDVKKTVGAYRNNP